MIPSSSLVYFISSLQSACPLPVFKSLYIVLSIVVHPSSGSFVSSASSQRFGITACNVCLSSIHVDLPYCCHSRSIDNCFYSSVRVSRWGCCSASRESSEWSSSLVQCRFQRCCLCPQDVPQGYYSFRQSQSVKERERELVLLVDPTR